jgi:hypothetical protein
MTEEAQYFSCFFPQKRLCINFGKMGWATFWATFLATFSRTRQVTLIARLSKQFQRFCVSSSIWFFIEKMSTSIASLFSLQENRSSFSPPGKRSPNNTILVFGIFVKQFL